MPQPRGSTPPNDSGAGLISLAPDSCRCKTGPTHGALHPVAAGEYICRGSGSAGRDVTMDQAGSMGIWSAISTS